MRIGHVVRRICKRLALGVGVLLMDRADLADRILRAVIPGHARFAVHVDPFAVFVAERAQSIPILQKRDVEVLSVAIADLPFAEEVATRRKERRSAGFGRSSRGGRELDTGNIREIEGLLVAVLEDQDNGSGSAFGRRAGLGKTA